MDIFNLIAVSVWSWNIWYFIGRPIFLFIKIYIIVKNRSDKIEFSIYERQIGEPTFDDYVNDRVEYVKYVVCKLPLENNEYLCWYMWLDGVVVRRFEEKKGFLRREHVHIRKKLNPGDPRYSDFLGLMNDRIVRLYIGEFPRRIVQRAAQEAFTMWKMGADLD